MDLQHRNIFIYSINKTSIVSKTPFKLISKEEYEALIALEGRPDKWDSIRDGCCPAEINLYGWKILSNYTYDLSDSINSHLRKPNDENHFLKECIRLLTRFLKDNERYSGEIVFREDNPYIPIIDRVDALFGWYERRIGQFVRRPEFLSTRKTKICSQDLQFSFKTLPHNSNAIDVTPFVSQIMAEYEQEVIFLPNTIFEIIRVDRGEKMIHLEEVLLEIECTPLDLFNEVYNSDPKIKALIEEHEKLNPRNKFQSLSDQGLI